MHILQTDFFHLGHAPLDGLRRGRRTGDASADVVAQFGEKFKCAWLHLSRAGNRCERFESAIVSSGHGRLLRLRGLQ